MIAAQSSFDSSSISRLSTVDTPPLARGSSRKAIEAVSGSNQALNLDQTANRLGISRQSIRKMLRENRLTGVQFMDEWYVQDSQPAAVPTTRSNGLTVGAEEAAERLQTSTTALYQQLRKGGLRGLKYKGNWHVAPEDVHVTQLGWES